MVKVIGAASVVGQDGCGRVECIKDGQNSGAWLHAESRDRQGASAQAQSREERAFSVQGFRNPRRATPLLLFQHRPGHPRQSRSKGLNGMMPGWTFEPTS